MALSNNINRVHKVSYKSMACLLAVLAADSSFFTVNTLSGTARIFMDIAAVILLAFSCGGKIRLGDYDLTVYFATVFVPILSGLLVGNAKQTTIICIAITCGFFVTRIMDEDAFLEAYEKILYFLSVYSLVSTIVFFIVPAITRVVPIVAGVDSEHTYYNFIFSIVSDNAYVTRNYGLFWEPGAFSIFISIAIWIQLYIKKEANIKSVLIYLITIISTLSTLGIVCAAILIFGYFLKNRETQKKSMQVVLVLIMVFFGIYLYFFGEDFVFHVFGKLQGKAGVYGSSTNTRIDAIKYPFETFTSSPIWGVGYDAFLRMEKYYCEEMATCTFLNWLAIYGIIWGLPMIVFSVNAFVKREKNALSKVVLVMFAVLLFSTENCIQIPMVYILMFYGATRHEKRSIYRN